MVRLAWTVVLDLSPSFSLAKQWLLRMRCREDFTIRPLGSETRKTSAALLRAAAAARRSQNGATAVSRLYRRRARATPPTPPGARPREGRGRGTAGKPKGARLSRRLIGERRLIRATPLLFTPLCGRAGGGVAVALGKRRARALLAPSPPPGLGLGRRCRGS